MVYLSEVVVEFGLWGEDTLLAVSAQAFAVISVLQLPWGLNISGQCPDICGHLSSSASLGPE